MVAFDDPALWDCRVKKEAATAAPQDREQKDTDWLCSYDTLSPFLSLIWGRPRATALYIGTGTSTFPEVVYDRGVKQAVVLDISEVAIDAVRARNAGRRAGLRAVLGDPSSDPFPELPDPAMAFDLVIDKGTHDTLLIREDGWRRAARSLAALYARMKTPGTFVLVSHSPPHERSELIDSAGPWHEVQCKVVVCTGMAALAAGAASTETVEDYPYAVPGWEERQAARRGVDVADLPVRPQDEDFGFAPGTAYIYVMEK
ncbi:hypothetical protein FOA52_007484 [Chlamydomonas sp. UWO 241]|nr:hypothetical protein FOA52_007484 [Chlamydomonas sp. UWO 241]